MGGTAADIAIQAKNLAHTTTTMQRLIAQHTGQDLETIKFDPQRDRWFAAEEVLAYGLVDHVVERVEDVRLGAGRKVGL